MKQSDLNRAVARLTGESVRLIRRRGFLLVNVVAKPQRQSVSTAQVTPHSSPRCVRVDLPPQAAA